MLALPPRRAHRLPTPTLGECAKPTSCHAADLAWNHPQLQASRTIIPLSLDRPCATCRTRLSCQTDIFAEQLADIIAEQ